MKPGGIDGRNIDTYRGVDPIEMSCFRTMFNCFITFNIMHFKYGKSIEEFPMYKYKIMLYRCYCGVTGFIAGAYSISFVPITVYSLMMNTRPFHVNILSYIFLGVVLLKRELFGMFVCFIGVIIFITGKAS